MSKKNLDQLFREKLEDFTDIPTEIVWKSIEASLDKKKKNRKVIPIWWKLGGIAAALAIGLFLINPFNGDVEINPTITNIENSYKKEDKTLDHTIVDDTPQVTGIEASKTTSEGGAANQSSGKETKQTGAVNGIEASNSIVGKGDNKTLIQNRAANKTSLALTKTSDPIKKEEQKQNEAIGNTLLQEKETTSDIAQTTSELKASDTKNLKEEIAQAATEEAVANTDKKSIFDEIDGQNEENEEVVKATPQGRWSAGPSVAPVYFNGMGEGSPVHPIFVPNSKSGDVNLSYGLAISYKINKKLSVKTGIHKVDYGYSTNDVEFSSSLESFAGGQLSNIDYSSTSRNIIVESKADNTYTASKETLAQDPSLYGIMAQQLGYLEVPIELNYALLDNKFGINLIGGFSSLFLMDNAVTLTSGELIAEMGEANNVNDVNFSTNVGFGLNYKFTPKIQFNVEPVFKYQLNTFSETSGNFQPFTIGVYSGLHFKF
ncbi:MAG: hypothetical protein KAJ23_11850 [Maribacter sp.]|nr:hypothetical protein [Maribacter sp.]